ncbi:MAG: tRNA pseudouridine(38-40) synthase TruA [Lunatimonas sp.]|uniref:tRNA pseudouridine(38-40) synthase TruA n=1 Tax=Lunatimonas sp. TaxID=2060141 RepID=UPI00263AA063|nr:tRNA pseudouridine(38-40) synthase TruA [Lunatimonas sp.]MCC5939696.1 tRNA pseudouridine(38-40) synthase TruA [Lunatimonas sp.]
MKRYFLELAYQGTNYHGWQIQENATSVQEVVQRALSTILRTPIQIMGSGRTDAGVHAKQQFAHFECLSIGDKNDFLKKINSVLPPDIGVFQVYEVKDDANARFAAQWRSYEYVIGMRKNPFEDGLVWRCFYELDITQMNLAADLLLNYDDFESFSRIKTETKHFRCKIKNAYWEQKDHHLLFHITANRFLRGMVRAIVGTLVLVGRGQLGLGDFEEIIQAKRRVAAGASAPPQGLYLSKVVYPSHIFI